MLPLGLLRAAQGQPLLAELKDGETYNGHLLSCDTWMNLVLSNVVQSAADGTKFFRMKLVYIRGNNIKYLRVPEETADKVKAQQQKDQQARSGRGGSGGASGAQGGRGDHAGRGDGGDRGDRGGGRGRGGFRGRVARGGRAT